MRLMQHIPVAFVGGLLALIIPPRPRVERVAI